MARITPSKIFTVSSFFDGIRKSIDGSAFDYTGETTIVAFTLSSGYVFSDKAIQSGNISAVTLYSSGRKLVASITGVSLDAALVWDLAGKKQGERLFQYILADDDTFTGTTGNDEFISYAGDDTLSGAAGTDSLAGGDGADSLNGGIGLDTLVGGLGDDLYFVDRTLESVQEDPDGGEDSVFSTATFSLPEGVEHLTLRGTAAISGTGNDGNNQLTGNTAANRLSGGAGKDTLEGEAGADTLTGGDGDDSYVVETTSDVIVERADGGTDTVRASVTWTLASNLENLALLGATDLTGTGNTLANVLVGNAGDNSLAGLAGNDKLDGAAGDDTLAGGSGNDTYFVDDAGDQVRESARSGTRDVVFATITFTLPAEVENLVLQGDAAAKATGNAAANELTGNDADNQLAGGSGNDTLTGNEGDDTLDGGKGGDALAGGVGDDVYLVDNTNDVIAEDSATGIDTVQATLGWTLSANLENLTLLGTGNLAGIGNPVDNTLAGNIGNNKLVGLGGDDTLSGGLGNDLLQGEGAAGTTGQDLQGDDSLDGGAGNDTLEGGAGADTLQGGAGADSLDGGEGTDSQVGGTGDDVYVVDDLDDVIVEAAGEGVDGVLARVSFTLSPNVENLVLTGTNAIDGTGNALANVLTGNDAANALSGADGSDSLVGDLGNDTLDGGAGADSLSGGLGNDTYVVDSASDVVVEEVGQGSDLVRAAATYTLGANLESLTLTGTSAIDGTGNALANVLTGNDGANALLGFSGDDSLAGGLGNDTLDGGAGLDTLVGGADDDVYVVDDAGDVVIEQPNEGTDAVRAAVGYALSAGIENLTLTGAGDIDGTGNAAANKLTGNDGANSLSGAEGNDSLTGGLGNDTLDGGAGIDTLVGGLGDDVYVVDGTTDAVTELAGQGTDTIRSSVSFSLLMVSNLENLFLTGSANLDATGDAGNNVLGSNAGNNVLDGGDGVDTVSYAALSLGVKVDLSLQGVNEQAQDTGAAGLDTLRGMENVMGGIGNDHLTGDVGNNTLDGGLGADTLVGGGGDDTFIVDNEGDVATDYQGAGIDTVISSVSWKLDPAIENLTLSGSEDRYGYGTLANTAGDGNNLIIGNDGDNDLRGYNPLQAGVVRIANEPVGTGRDTLFGGKGNDHLYGGDDTDSLDGGVGNDTLEGGTGNDSLVAGSGNDELRGGAGNDSLTGGAGRDRFVFASALDASSEVDTLADFNAAEDLLVLQSDIFTKLDPNEVDVFGHWLSENFREGAVALDANDYVLYDPATGHLSYDADGSGTNAAPIRFAILPAGLKLSDANFEVASAQSSAVDTQIGSAGPDFYTVDSAEDVIVEPGGGTDTVSSSVSYALGAGLDVLWLQGDQPLTGSGNSTDDWLLGNSANNLLSGGPGDDTVEGGAGVDTLEGGLGDDLYVVDNANDVLLEFLDSGVETVESSVSWTLDGAFENLRLTGSAALSGTGNDLGNILIGNDGANKLSGLLGQDSLSGGLGNDTLDGGGGVDTLVGGLGDDLYLLNDANDTVIEALTAGSDEVRSSVTIAALWDSVESLTLLGTDDISATGNALPNKLIGNEGANTLDGGAGADTLAGGLGNDVFEVADVGDSVVEASGEGVDLVRSSISIATLWTNVENLTLLAGAVNGTGNVLDNALIGNDVANVLTGGLGNDTLDGGSGSDVLTGGEGDDFYVVDSLSDVINESADQGTDTVRSTVGGFTLPSNVENIEIVGQGGVSITGNALDNVIFSSAGNDTLDGGSGNDTASYANLSTKVVVNLHLLGSAQNTRAGGVDTLVSIENVTGGSAGDFLFGSLANNTLDGGAGADTMNGGYGDDTFIVDNASDIATEWQDAGTDTVIASVSWRLDPAIENLTLGGQGSLYGFGNLSGSQNTAGTGNNHLKGNAANNLLMGYNPFQPVPPSTATVAQEKATLYAVVAAATSTGNDTLDGGDGNDVLFGGGGVDSLMGGSGEDIFVFNAAPTGLVSTIGDFDIADDRIALHIDVFVGRQSDGTYAPLTSLENDWFGQWASDNLVNAGGAIGGLPDANDYIQYNFSTGALFYDADGNGGVAAVQFAQLSPGLYLSDVNFILYDTDDPSAPRNLDSLLIGQFLT